ncbi:MAG: dihydroxyacetone kinase subunit DhaL [Desulfurococcaceae archaeon]
MGTEVGKVHTIDSKTFLKVLDNILEVMKANEKYLTKLDADIGDADHGINMVRGFQKVKELINRQKNPENLDIGTMLNLTGMGLLQVVGGAAGPLYGMLFLEASKTVRGKKEISVDDFAKILEAGLKAVRTVGGGTIPGEKTMVDVLHPVVEKLKEMLSTKKDLDFIEALSEIVPLARESVLKTIPMLAKRGRASYLGERSIGHQDPGATSTYLIIRTFLDTLSGKTGVKISKYDDVSGALISEEFI